jgi:methanogenic corrinoid protein MtbC1
MWATGEAMPVQEHFASTIIRRKLLSAIDGQHPPTVKNKKFLLALPPNEWHEIGLLFADYILRSKGYQTLYLGANVPYENISEISKQTKITHMLTFLITRRTEKEISELRKNMHLAPDVQLFVAGNTDIIKNVEKHKNTQILFAADNLLKSI